MYTAPTTIQPGGSHQVRVEQDIGPVAPPWRPPPRAAPPMSGVLTRSANSRPSAPSPRLGSAVHPRSCWQRCRWLTQAADRSGTGGLVVLGCLSCVQQGTDLLIGGLRKVPVGLPDGHKQRRRAGADNLIGSLLQRLAGRGGRDRHRDHHPGWLLAADRGHRRPHGRPGGQAVVDHDHHLASELRRWPLVPVGALTAFQLLVFGRGHGLERVLGDAELAHNPPVHNPGAVAGDGAHGQLLTPWDAQLADRQHLQGCPSDRATRKPTGTPPRGKANTTTSGEPAYLVSRSASTRPASARSWNW